MDVDAELRTAALAAGLVDVDLVALIDHTHITTAADGTLAGIDAAIAEFKRRKPMYFSARTEPRAEYHAHVRDAQRSLKEAESRPARDHLAELATAVSVRGLDRGAYNARLAETRRTLSRSKI